MTDLRSVLNEQADPDSMSGEERAKAPTNLICACTRCVCDTPAECAEEGCKCCGDGRD